MSGTRPIPAWLRAFESWWRRPSLSGEWLYRGQAAAYGAIVPSMLRNPHRDQYGSRLRILDKRIADVLLATSPVLGPSGLYPHLIADSAERSIQALTGRLLGVPNRSLPRLDASELVRALAQHYGFPTLFVDVSLDPVVAAFFATHSFAGGRYEPRDEPGVVYRWPTERVSPARLEIPAARGATPGCDTIAAIDISIVNPHVRRPHNQSAVLVVPVTRELDLIPPETLAPPGGRSIFSTPLAELTCQDLARLACCETFELPGGAGRELKALTGVSAEALFPDGIDLGYSYLSVMAFLSIAAHDRVAWGVPRDEEPGVAGMRAAFRDILLSARALLERECLRLIPQCPVGEAFRERTLLEASSVFMLQVDMARGAAELLGTERVSAGVEALNAKLLDAAKTELARRQAELVSAVRKVRGEAAASALRLPAFEPEVLRGDKGWIVPELERRWRRVEEIFQHAEKVPAWALEDRVAYARFRRGLPTDAEYERRLRRQITAQRTWRKNAPVFLPLVPSDAQGGPEGARR